MRVLLAALMCFVFTMTQALAISGGPWDSGSHVTVTGTYAGVLTPVVIVVNPGPPPVTLPPDNSLALFTMKIPQTGLGSGDAVIFRNGFFYPGTINASGDPDSGKISALISGSFTKTYTVGSDSFTFNFNANGSFDTVKAVVNQQSAATSGVRLKGRASITYTTENNPNNPDFAAGSSGGPIQYKVKGFKQSEQS